MRKSAHRVHHVQLCYSFYARPDLVLIVASVRFILCRNFSLGVFGVSFSGLFSKSVLDIRTRLVVTVKPETKWMPNSDSALKLVPKCKILCQYDLLNYFYSCLKIAVF